MVADANLGDWKPGWLGCLLSNSLIPPRPTGGGVLNPGSVAIDEVVLQALLPWLDPDVLLCLADANCSRYRRWKSIDSGRGVTPDTPLTGEACADLGGGRSGRCGDDLGVG